MKRPRLFVSLLLAACGTCVLLLSLVLSGFGHLRPAGAAAASNPPPRQKTGQVHIMKTHRTGQNGNVNTDPPVQYNGGPVMQSTSTTYAIFWVPPTLQDGTPTYVSPNYSSLLLRYFNDVGGSYLYDNNTQYYDSTGHIVNSSAFGASWLDTSAYPASDCTDQQTPGDCMSDALIQAEIAKAMATNGWSADLTHVFFVFTAWGEGSCSDSNSTSCAFTNYCSYHSNFNNNGQTVIYADIPYSGTNLSDCGVPTSPNNDFDTDSAINLVSYEHMEAVTDPQLNAWYDSNGSEIGDKCAWNFGSIKLDGATADVQWHNHYYIVQQAWSNVFHRCVVDGEQGTVFVTSYNGNLTALNVNDGYKRWFYHTHRIQGSSPTIANGIVYFGSDDGYVYAMKAGKGLVWRYHTDAAIVTSTPAVASGVVYVAGTSLYALNASNGSLLWRFQPPVGASSAPTVVNGVVYIGEGDGYLYALNASNATQLWRFQTGMFTYSTPPTVSNGVVYVGSSNHSLYALNASDGSLLWSYATNGGINSSAAVSNGVVYIGSGDDSLYALNASNGTLLWSYQTGDSIWSTPTIVNGVVYFGSNDFFVYALNANNGLLLWRYQTGGRVFSSPTIVNGLLYIGSEDSYVYLLNTNDGTLSWRSSVGASVYTTPAVYLKISH